MTAYVRHRFGQHAAATDHGDDWRDQALCREHDPELFHPVGDGGPARWQEQEALKVCRRCAVKRPCLLGALAEGDDWSVRGGMTARQRRLMEVRDGQVVPRPTKRQCGRCRGPLPDGVSGNTRYCPACVRPR